MPKTWTPEEEQRLADQLTQMGSPYIQDGPTTEELIRVNAVAHEWSDGVLKAIVRKGPGARLLTRICAELLQARENERRWAVEQRHREETTRALAEIKRATEAGAPPHWSATWGFWVMVATLVAALIAAWPVLQGWFR